MSYFIYTDLISILLDQSLVDPGLTLIYVGAYDRKSACYNIENYLKTIMRSQNNLKFYV